MKKITIDLITGFLGSGKTTFLRNYACFLMKKGEHLGILENDFGAVNVDMMLLQDLMGEQCEMEMIAGGCDAETHRRRFRTKLISMAMEGYDRIIVEPSGIFDVDEFFDLLREEPLDRWYEAGSVIGIVEAGLEEEMSNEAEYLLASEIACAGGILLSKTAKARETEIQKTLDHLNRALEQVHCSRKLERKDLISKEWDLFAEEDYENVRTWGYRREDFEKQPMLQESVYETMYLMNYKFTKECLKRWTKEVMDDPLCGKILRIKGFFREAEEGWQEWNATSRERRMRPIASGQEILIVIGEHLNRERIEAKLTDVSCLPSEE